MNEYGKVDILVNNAGMTINEKAEDVSYENWLKVINKLKWCLLSSTSSRTSNDKTRLWFNH